MSKAIPSGVYYSAVHDNFYRMTDHAGLGMAFWHAWRNRCWEFPAPNAQAIEAQRAGTTKIGPVADESAVAESDAPIPDHSSETPVE